MNERKLRKIILNSLPIETERLILRYIEIDDAYDMYEYASDPEVCEFLLWSPHLNISATEGYIESLVKRYKKGLFADWAVVLKESGKMIGTCGYASISATESSCEIGYVLSPKYRSRGYMTEAVNAVLKLSFEQLGLKHAHLRIIAQNSASVRLAERIGFTLDYIGYSEMNIKGIDRDIAHYVLTKDTYNSIKNN